MRYSDRGVEQALEADERAMAGWTRASSFSAVFGGQLEGDVTQEWEVLSDARGWALNVARLRLDLYRLVSAMFASEKYAWAQVEADQAAWPQPTLDVGPTLERLAADFEASEIEHGLVSVAAMTRVLLDQASPWPQEARASCGVLIPDLSEPTREQQLTLREACNKVLHANTRRFVADHHLPGLIARMELFGSQLQRQWKANLHIVAFAALVAQLTSGRPTPGSATSA